MGISLSVLLLREVFLLEGGFEIVDFVISIRIVAIDIALKLIQFDH